MMRVWIVQCLCPERHAIAASFGEADSERAAERGIGAPLLLMVGEAINAGSVNPWCGLCGATSASWCFEVKRTRFRTMAEAEPEMRRLAAEQAITRAAYADRGATVH